MNAARAKQQPTEGVPKEFPASTPGYSGHHDHSFTLQAVMELQKSVGELKSSLDSLTVVVQGAKNKVDDLVGWKNKIIGGAAVLGAVIAVIGFIVGKFWDYITISPPISKPPVIAQPQQPDARPPASAGK